MFDWRKATIASLAVAGIGGWFGYQINGGSDREIDFLAVGQGDCAVVRSGDLTALIDAGPKSDWFDAGERLVAPELRRMGVTRLDLVLLSHPDADHIGGLAAEAKRFHIGAVLISAAFQRHPEMVAALREAGLSPKQIVFVSDGQTIEFGDWTLRITCPKWSEGLPDNDGSMIVQAIDAGGGSALFMGDASELVESTLMESGQWHCDVLKAGHHGSRTSTSSGWLKRTQPKWTVLSCGRDNVYGHPAMETVSRIQSAGSEPLRTDRMGTIRFRFDASGAHLER